MDIRLGDMGMSLLLSAIGSGMAVGVAGMAAIGVWKKLYMQNKIGPFILIAFVGAPLSQTIYGMIIRSAIQSASHSFESQIPLLVLGTLTGAVMGYSAWLMGKAGACAADAMGESGKGFGNYIMVIGVIETISLFILVSTLGALPK